MAKTMSEFITIPLSKTGKKHKGLYETIVSPEDADLADFNWCVYLASYTQYARRTVSNSEIRLGNIILERIIQRPLSPLEQVDHIDRDGLNNQRYNLRIATHSQNQMNKRIQSNNTSNVTGVLFRQDSQKWRAVININGRIISMGNFNIKEQAIAARKEAEKKYYGEFARQ